MICHPLSSAIPPSPCPGAFPHAELTYSIGYGLCPIDSPVWSGLAFLTHRLVCRCRRRRSVCPRPDPSLCVCLVCLFSHSFSLSLSILSSHHQRLSCRRRRRRSFF